MSLCSYKCPLALNVLIPSGFKCLFFCNAFVNVPLPQPPHICSYLSYTYHILEWLLIYLSDSPASLWAFGGQKQRAHVLFISGYPAFAPTENTNSPCVLKLRRVLQRLGLCWCLLGNQSLESWQVYINTPWACKCVSEPRTCGLKNLLSGLYSSTLVSVQSFHNDGPKEHSNNKSWLSWLTLFKPFPLLRPWEAIRSWDWR